tara:strand:+ start:94 stop:1176 length:1083 start_codon:yes stop_codon:yes gene_type:complete
MENIDNIKNAVTDLKDNIGEKIINVKDAAKDIGDNIKETITALPKAADPKSDGFIGNSKEFLSSNTLIAKATFLLLVIIIFGALFYLLSRLLIWILSPSENPYIINGMKKGNTSMIITQDLSKKKSIPLFRSKNEYDGIEFTYSFWMYVDDIDYNDDDTFKHVFHKGNIDHRNFNGTYKINNSPGVYLYTGKRSITSHKKDDPEEGKIYSKIDSYPQLGMLVRMNVFHNNENKSTQLKYYDDIYVDGLPIKKWVNVIVRTTSQNIVDVYINGVLTKRHKLTNIVKQNYDNLYINMNGGYGGNLSNLKYYNYAIGTFEIDQIVSNGPNLKMMEDTNISNSAPAYIASDWFFDDMDIGNNNI